MPEEHHETADGAWRGPSIARATYGLISTMAVLAAWSAEHAPSATTVLESILGTAVIFWLAHIYAEAMEAAATNKRSSTREELLAIFAHEWPIVHVAALPAFVMLLSAVGVLGTHAAIDVALYACLIELGLIGITTARRAGARGIQMLIRGGGSLALGIAIVVLKTLVH